jgi:hypothetical protein
LVPPSFELEHLAPRTAVALVFLVIGEIRYRKPVVCGRVVAHLRDKPRISAAKVPIRAIGIELFLSAALEILFALIITIGAEDLPSKVILREPKSLHRRFGPLQPGSDMPIGLAVAKRLRMDADLRFGIDHRLAIVAREDAVGREHVGRLVICHVTDTVAEFLPTVQAASAAK